jgi:methionine biosynthesis protein MetW
MQLQIENYYDNYWKWVKKLPPSSYERDLVFPEIFRRGENVLDLACGNGDSSLQIAKLTQKKVSGLDISKVAVTEAIKKGVKAKVASVEGVFPFKTGVFDTVFWGDNIEHIFFPEKAITEIRRVLKPSGRLVISTPNMSYWRYRVSYLLSGKIPDTEFNGKPPWAWSHIRFFNSNILNNFLKANGFKMTKIWGINRRKIDKWLVRLFPNFCGMILVIEAVKK